MVYFHSFLKEKREVSKNEGYSEGEHMVEASLIHEVTTHRQASFYVSSKIYYKKANIINMLHNFPGVPTIKVVNSITLLNILLTNYQF